MKLCNTSIKRVALVLLAAAVVVPAAQAASDSGSPVAGFDHLQELTAMAKQYNAQISRYAATPAGLSHLQDLTAMANRYNAAGNSHLQDLTAMANRYNAQASRIAPTPPGYSHLQELTAMNNEYKAQVTRLAATPPGYSHLQDLTAMANGAGRLPIVGSVNVRTPAATISGGFDWADAGIGAMSGFAAALALAGTLLFVLRRRPRGADTRTPKTA